VLSFDKSSATLPFWLAFGVVALPVLVLGGARIVMQRNQRLSCTLLAAIIRVQWLELDLQAFLPTTIKLQNLLLAIRVENVQSWNKLAAEF
jgi:hypothetical protein